MIYYTQHTESEIRKRSDLTHFLEVKLIHTNPCFLFIAVKQLVIRKKSVDIERKEALII